MNNRVKTATAGLGLATILGLGALSGQSVFAQADTTTPTPPAAASDAKTARETAAAEAYNAFVANLATQLGSDPAKVDAAIRASLKQQIDDKVAAGDLAANTATAMKEAIDASAAPLHTGGFGFGEKPRGDWGGPDRGRHGEFRRGQNRPSDLSGNSDEDNNSEATPAARIGASLYL